MQNGRKVLSVEEYLSKLKKHNFESRAQILILVRKTEWLFSTILKDLAMLHVFRGDTIFYEQV